MPSDRDASVQGVGLEEFARDLIDTLEVVEGSGTTIEVDAEGVADLLTLLRRALAPESHAPKEEREWRDVAAYLLGDCVDTMTPKEARAEAVRRVLAGEIVVPDAPQGEPYAWLVERNQEGFWIAERVYPVKPAGFEGSQWRRLVPLYARPAAAPQRAEASTGAGEPEVTIAGIIEGHLGAWHNWHVDEATWRESVERAACEIAALLSRTDAAPLDREAVIEECARVVCWACAHNYPLKDGGPFGFYHPKLDPRDHSSPDPRDPEGIFGCSSNVLWRALTTTREAAPRETGEEG